MDVRLQLTSAAFAYGEIVWVRRPDAGVKSARGESLEPAMVSQRAGSPGRSRISRKTIAWGRPECFSQTCMLVGRICYLFRHETAGAASTRSSPRPLIWEGEV